jgi:hypothetical protein
MTVQGFAETNNPAAPGMLRFRGAVTSGTDYLAAALHFAARARRTLDDSERKRLFEVAGRPAARPAAAHSLDRVPGARHRGGAALARLYLGDPDRASFGVS